MTEIRELRAGGTPFLHAMLYAALAWRSGVQLPPNERVLEHPQVALPQRLGSGW